MKVFFNRKKCCFRSTAEWAECAVRKTK